MKLRNHLNNDQKKKMLQMVKYSEKELHELMGVNRDTYKKVKGRVRRK